MIRLNLQREPYWLDLPSNVRVCIKPLTSALMSAAQNSVIKEATRLRETNNLPEDDSMRAGVSESLLVKALARNAILEWEGVLTADETKPAQVTDENVSELMDIWFIAQDFWRQYTKPLAMLAQEGKQSELSLGGTSAEAPNTASAVMNKNCRAAKARKTQKQGNIANI